MSDADVLDAPRLAAPELPAAPVDKWGHDPIVKPASKGKWGNDPVVKPAPEKVNGGRAVADMGPGAAVGALVGANAPVEQMKAEAPTIGSEAAGVAGDAARGVIGLAGTPGLIAKGLGKADDAISSLPAKAIMWSADKLGLLPAGKHYADAVAEGEKLSSAYHPENASALTALPTPDEIQGGIEKATGPIPEPQTGIGNAIGSVAEFAPQALFGGPIKEVAGRLLKWAVAPGLASEGAARLTAGTKAEPAARFAGSLLGGGGAALLTRESAAANAVSKAFEHVEPADRAKFITGAYSLMKDGEKEGVALTWPEALKKASGGRVDLTGQQRVVEGTGRLATFMGDRPGQVDAATARHMDAISPATDQPSTIGPAVGKAAEQHLSDVQTDINAQTRPDYQAAEQADVGPHVAAAMALDPRYAHALGQVRGDPFLNAGIEHLPDSSGAVVDRVNKRLGEIQKDATNPVGTQGQSGLRAMSAGTARQTPEQVLDVASGGRYGQAELDQAKLREQHLDPLLAGPLGKMQNQPSTQQAIDALFGDNAQSGAEVGTAVSALNGKNPWAARQVVRAYVEGVFAKAHAFIGDQFTGAKLANTLQANPQTAERLSSALAALPNGAHIAPGFSLFLDIMGATGMRQRAGSMTSFNTEMMNEMKSNAGGAAGAAAGAAKQLITAGFKWPAAVAKKFEQWSLGKNLDDLADLLVNPEAAQRFRQLSEAPLGSGRSLMLAARLGAIAGQGIRHRAKPASE